MLTAIFQDSFSCLYSLGFSRVNKKHEVSNVARVQKTIDAEPMHMRCDSWSGIVENREKVLMTKLTQA
jgi:hypothetical protein